MHSALLFGYSNKDKAGKRFLGSHLRKEPAVPGAVVRSVLHCLIFWAAQTWGSRSSCPFPEATLCSPWRQHCNGTGPAGIPATLTWGCWQHGINNLCWDSLKYSWKHSLVQHEHSLHHIRNRNYVLLRQDTWQFREVQLSRAPSTQSNLVAQNQPDLDTDNSAEKKNNHLTWWFKHKWVSQYCRVNPDTLNRIFQSRGVQPTAKNNISVVQSIQL